MEKITVTIYLIPSFLCIIHPTFAYITTCYNCKYVNDIDLINSNEPFPLVPVDESCSSSSPKHELLIECYRYKYDAFGRPTTKYTEGDPAFHNNTHEGPKDGTFACIKLTFEGNEPLTETEMSMTIRSCISIGIHHHAPKRKQAQVCYHNKKSKIGKEIYAFGVKDWIIEHIFDDEVDVGVCTCNKPGCNEGIKMRSGSLLQFLLAFFTILSSCGGRMCHFTLSKMNKFSVVLISVVFFTSQFAPAKALNCFHCKYVDGIETHVSDDTYPIEDSCGTNRPNPELGANCKYIPIYHDVPILSANDSHPDSKTGSVNMDHGDDTKYSCIKITYAGKHKGTGNGITMTIRSCVINYHVGDAAMETLPDICYRNPKDKIFHIIKLEHIRTWVRHNAFDADTHFDAGVDVNVCSCNENACNRAVKIYNGSGTLFLLVIFQLLMMCFLF
ncbi:unnamed protein product [Orchesella dallaii]|uniref:Protein quiver n=1 Tax=Orchesella dallaii TaxID=48710 RepID=A0ABP1Q7B9_9HEXA